MDKDEVELIGKALDHMIASGNLAEDQGTELGAVVIADAQAAADIKALDEWMTTGPFDWTMLPGAKGFGVGAARCILAAHLDTGRRVLVARPGATPADARAQAVAWIRERVPKPLRICDCGRTNEGDNKCPVCEVQT